MLLVDTSVWVDHLNKGDTGLAKALSSGRVICHPYIIGEIALGSLKARGVVLSLLADLPAISVASPEEIIKLIENKALYSRGIGYVDICLIASVLLSPGVQMWTRDKKLNAVCEELGISR